MIEMLLTFVIALLVVLISLVGVMINYKNMALLVLTVVSMWLPHWQIQPSPMVLQTEQWMSQLNIEFSRLTQEQS